MHRRMRGKGVCTRYLVQSEMRGSMMAFGALWALTPIFDAYFYTWISKYQSSHNPFHVTNFDFALWRIAVVYPPLATSQIEVATEYWNQSDLFRSSKYTGPPSNAASAIHFIPLSGFAGKV